jgi:hypothetical protein
MNQKNWIIIWKTIPLLCAFSFSLLMFVCVFFVNGTISALPFFASYIDAGSSFFLPFIPRINLFCFLPEDAQILPFTFGHLIDFIIIVNLSMVINPIAFPFYKKVSNEYQNNMYYDLHLGAIHPRQRVSCALFDMKPAILLEKHDALDHSGKMDSKRWFNRMDNTLSRLCDDDVFRQYRKVRIAVTSFVHRSRGRFFEHVFVTARTRFARAFRASFFAPTRLIFARYR